MFYNILLVCVNNQIPASAGMTKIKENDNEGVCNYKEEIENNKGGRYELQIVIIWLLIVISKPSIVIPAEAGIWFYRLVKCLLCGKSDRGY